MKNKYFLFILFILAFPLSSAELDQYCTTSLAGGNFHKTDCSVNANFEGKKYCFGNKVSKSIFLKDPKITLAKATVFYTKNSNDTRDKISQNMANELLDDPDCNLSNKDVAPLIKSAAASS